MAAFLHMHVRRGTARRAGRHRRWIASVVIFAPARAAAGNPQCAYIVRAGEKEAATSETEIEWEKELRILLDKVNSRPSEDWTEERERIAVLKNLMATKQKSATPN